MRYDLLDYFESLGLTEALVVGDVMLDRYIFGAVERVSPESPVPVVHVNSRSESAGGAANVACMLAEFGCSVTLYGSAGDDADYKCLQNCLPELVHFFNCLGPSTTVKTRVIGTVKTVGHSGQQVVRFDDEVEQPSPNEEQLSDIVYAAEWHDVVLIQDMGKGFVSRELIDAVCNSGVKVIADPYAGRDLSFYKGVDVILPNRHEAEMFVGQKFVGESLKAIRDAAVDIQERLKCELCVVKLDRDGLYYVSERDTKHIITTPKEVADVSGAGDMVATVMTMAFGKKAPAAQIDCDKALQLANFAAGLEVEYIGAVPIPRSLLVSRLKAKCRTVETAKIVQIRGELDGILRGERRAGKKIVLTNGCFDLLHIGHLSVLKFAKQQGDVLIVGVNSDRSVQANKGPSRPINGQDIRCNLIAAMEDVDYVVVFDEPSVEPLVKEVSPDVLVKGGQYAEHEVVGWEHVKSCGGVIARCPHVGGYSTTELISKIKNGEQ